MYLLFNNLPPLASSCGERTPNLLAHGKILLCHALKLACVPVVSITLLNETFMALATGIGSLVVKRTLNLGPVVALGPQSHESVIVLHRPSPGTGAVRMGHGHGRCKVLLLVGVLLHGARMRTKGRGRGDSSGGRGHVIVASGRQGHALLGVQGGDGRQGSRLQLNGEVWRVGGALPGTRAGISRHDE